MKLPFKPYNNPILILSDAPEALTGLARVARDIASLLCTLPQFRVGYLARGGVGRRKFPWKQYSYPETGQWGEEHLGEVWADFSAGENGIIWSNWDASRMLWFGQPQGLRAELARFLGPCRNFEKWGYFPVDGTGPDGASLGTGMTAAVNGYDRVLAASEWGKERLRYSGMEEADWIPHGVWTDVFAPQASPHTALGWKEGDVYLGCVMTNQARKDWPAAFECAAVLKADYGNRFHFWAHTDALIHYWNLYALASDYGLADCLEVTMEQTDTQMALRYSACDCTILPSAGEGFGFPIAESMACGTACVVTNYAAGQELVNQECRVDPVAYRVDTMHNVQRAVLSGFRFAQKAKLQVELKRMGGVGGEEYGVEMRRKVEHLGWEGLQHVWKRWFLRGVGVEGVRV